MFRYVDVNPNGSLHDIAGITNERGNVVGLMPHPEHAIEPGFGPDTAAAMRSGVDGLTVLHERRRSAHSSRRDREVRTSILGLDSEGIHRLLRVVA